MNLSRIAAFVLTLLAMPALPLAAQQEESDFQQLQRLIKALETKLEAAQDIENPRVDQIGQRTTAASPPPSAPQMVIRLYRLDDLFVVAPAYNAFKNSDLGQGAGPLFPQAIRASGGGAQTPFVTSIVPGVGQFGGGGFFGSNPFEGDGRTAVVEESRTSIDDLLEVITTVIDPQSWDAVGGDSTLTMFGSSLVVNAQQSSHQQIDALLELMRKQSRAQRTVVVDAHWLWLTEVELQSLRPAAADRAAGGSLTTIYAAAFEKLMPADAKESAVAWRSALTCHNGQTVSTVSGKQSLAVTDMRPVAVADPEGKQDSSTVYRPQVAVVQEGAALQVTPTISINGGIVVLDIHSRVVTADDAAPAADPIAPAKSAGPLVSPAELVAALDWPQLTVHQFSSTMRVPVGQTVLIGGMTMDGSTGKRNLYLFAKAQVEELRDDAPEVPEAAEAPPAE